MKTQQYVNLIIAKLFYVGCIYSYNCLSVLWRKKVSYKMKRSDLKHVNDDLT